MTGIENHIGDYGVAIALLISAVLIIRALTEGGVRAMGMWREAAKERNTIDQRRNEVDEIVAAALKGVVAQLEAMTARAENTMNMVDGFRREAALVHGSQLEMLGEMRGMIADIPSATAQLVRASILDNLMIIQGKLDDTKAKIAALAEVDKARPITPGRGIENAVERVRIEQAAREQMATMDARKTGEHAVAPPAGERVTDANEQQGG